MYLNEIIAKLHLSDKAILYNIILFLLVKDINIMSISSIQMTCLVSMTKLIFFILMLLNSFWLLYK